MSEWSEITSVGALLAGLAVIALWRRVADGLWTIALEGKVKAAIAEHVSGEQADRAQLLREVAEKREMLLEPLRTGIAACGTDVAKLKDQMVEELAAVEEQLLDPSQLRRFKRFFEGNGASELHQLRNQIGEITMLPALSKQVDRMQAEQVQDRTRLEQALSAVDSIRHELRSRHEESQRTEESLDKLARELREKLGLPEPGH